MYENIEPEFDPIEDFRLLENSRSEYTMIWQSLIKASTTALTLNNQIRDVILMCNESKHLHAPYLQLNDMDYDDLPETDNAWYEVTDEEGNIVRTKISPDEVDYTILKDLRDLLAEALDDVQKAILPETKYPLYRNTEVI